MTTSVNEVLNITKAQGVCTSTFSLYYDGILHEWAMLGKSNRPSYKILYWKDDCWKKYSRFKIRDLLLKNYYIRDCIVQ